MITIIVVACNELNLSTSLSTSRLFVARLFARWSMRPIFSIERPISPQNLRPGLAAIQSAAQQSSTIHKNRKSLQNFRHTDRLPPPPPIRTHFFKKWIWPFIYAIRAPNIDFYDSAIFLGQSSYSTLVINPINSLPFNKAVERRVGFIYGRCCKRYVTALITMNLLMKSDCTTKLMNMDAIRELHVAKMSHFPHRFSYQFAAGVWPFNDR